MLREVTIYGNKVELVPLGHRMKLDNSNVKYYGKVADKEIYYSNNITYALY